MEQYHDTFEEVQFDAPGASGSSMEVQVGSSPVEPESDPDSPRDLGLEAAEDDVDHQLDELQRLALIADRTYDQINSVLAARVAELDPAEDCPAPPPGETDSGRATMEGGVSKEDEGTGDRNSRNPLARSTPKEDEDARRRSRSLSRRGHIQWADDVPGLRLRAPSAPGLREQGNWTPYVDPSVLHRPATPGKMLSRGRPISETAPRPGAHPYARELRERVGSLPVQGREPAPNGPELDALGTGKENVKYSDAWLSRDKDALPDRLCSQSHTPGDRDFVEAARPSGHVPRTLDLSQRLSGRRRLTMTPGGETSQRSEYSSGAETSEVETPSRGKRYHKKAMKYDGKSGWLDYLRQFEIIAKLNGWTFEEMAMELATSLDGVARDVLTNLSMSECVDYEALKQALRLRFEPDGQHEVHENDLRNRKRKRTETIPELLQDVKRLVKRAYPSANPETLQQISKSAFIAALSDEKQELFVKSRMPQTVEDAAHDALSYETHVNARSKSTKELSGRAPKTMGRLLLQGRS